MQRAVQERKVQRAKLREQSEESKVQRTKCREQSGDILSADS